MLEHIQKNYEVWVEWISTILIIIGVILTSFDFTPLNKVILLLGAIGWTWVGILWKHKSVWLLNGFIAIVYTVGLFL